MNEIKQGTTYTLADCGIFSAFALVLVLISTYIPILGSFTMLIWAVPIVALVLRRGVGAGIIAGVVVLLLSVMLTGPVMGIIAGITICIYGITYGVCFKKGSSPGKTMFIGTIVAGLVTFLTLAVSMLLTNLSVSDLFSGLEKNFRQVFEMYEEMGVLAQMIPEGYTSAEYMDKMLATLYQLLPGVFIFASMAIAALNYIFSALILRKLHFEIKPLPPFREWHFPWWILWGVALILLGLFMGNRFNNENYSAIAMNLLYIYLPLFFVSGVSIISYFFQIWKLKKGTQVIIWIISIFFMSFSAPFVVLMGAMDVLLDYRKFLRKAMGQKTDKN